MWTRAKGVKRKEAASGLRRGQAEVSCKGSKWQGGCKEPGDGKRQSKRAKSKRAVLGTHQ
jgi:hypothetical protein